MDDVFATVKEHLSSQDSTRKEFHCAVLRALSKEPSVTEAAGADQAPGTPDEAESCLKSGLPFPSSPAQPPPVSLHTTALGDVGTPCLLSSPFSAGSESAAVVAPHASILPTHSSILSTFA